MLKTSMFGTSPVPSLHETAYPRLKSSLSLKELTAIYTPSAEDIQFAQQHTRNRRNRLCFLLCLKSFQRLGYAVHVSDLPVGIIQYLVKHLGQSISTQELSKYDQSSTRKRHLSVIRKYLGLQAYDHVASTAIHQSMESTVQTKHDLVDMINVAIEELVRQRFELPAFSTFERKARKVRNQITQACYQQICDSLEREDKIQINCLFLTKEHHGYTLWNELNQDPGRPTINKF